MGLLRDLIERKHQDARDAAFRQHDTDKTIVTDTRKAGLEGGFTEEAKNEALGRLLESASPTKKHAETVKPIFQHLLGLAGPMLGGRGQSAQGTPNVGREAMGPPQAPAGAVDATGAPTAPAAAPVAAGGPSANLAVDESGAPLEADAGGYAAPAPVTTGSVQGDTSVAANPAPQAVPSSADPNAVYNSVPGVSPPVGPPGTEGTPSMSPRGMLTGDYDPEQEGMATSPSFRERVGQPELGQAANVGSTRAAAAPAQSPSAPPSRGNAPVTIKAQTPQGTTKTPTHGFLTMQESMDRARQIAEYNVDLQGQMALRAEPARQALMAKQLEFQLQQMADLVKSGVDPQLAAVRVGFKAMPGAYYTSLTAPVPGASIRPYTDPETGEEGTGFARRSGKIIPTPGLKANVPRPPATPGETPARKDALEAYATKLHKVNPDGSPNVSLLTAQERLDAMEKVNGQLAQAERAKSIVEHPELHDPSEVEAAKLILKGMEQKQTQVGLNITQEGNKIADYDEAKRLGNYKDRDPSLDPNARDEGVIAHLTPLEKQQVRNIANYKMALTPYMIGRAQTPYWANMMTLASVYDPTFRQGQYETRQKVVQSFTSGKDADKNTSLNTVIGHMGTLAEMAYKLSNNKVQFANELKNYVHDKMGRPEVNNFNMAAGAVIDELANVFKASGVTDQSVEQWKATIKAAQSPDQLSNAIKTGERLLVSRISSLAGKWHNDQAMGDTPFTILNPHSIEVLKQLGMNTDELGLRPQDLPRQTAAPAPSGQAGGQGAGSDINGQVMQGYKYTAIPLGPQEIQALNDGKAHTYQPVDAKRKPVGQSIAVKIIDGKAYRVEKVGQ